MTLRTYHTRNRADQTLQQLTALDQGLIRMLSQLGYATTRQLELLCLPEAPTPARQRRVRRRLTHLERLRVCYRLKRPIGGLGGGSRGSVWTLERTGLAIAKPGLRLRDVRPARERGRAFIEHALSVSEHCVSLHQHVHRLPGARVIAWLGEPDCHIAHHDPLTGRGVWLTPDALCEVHTPNEAVVSLVEIDMGSEGRVSLERKASRYTTYAARHPECPRVVWSFTTVERAAMFSRALDRSFRQPALRALLGRGLFVVTTSDAAAAALCGEEVAR